MSEYIDPVKEVLLKELDDLRAKAEWLKKVCNEETAICDEKINILNHELGIIKNEISIIDGKYTRKVICSVPVTILISGFFLILFSKIFTLFGMEIALSIVISLFTTCSSFLLFFTLYLFRQNNMYSHLTSSYILKEFELYMKINEYQLSKIRAKRNYEDECKLVAAKEMEIDCLDNTVPNRSNYSELENVINKKPMMRKLVRDDD